MVSLREGAEIFKARHELAFMKRALAEVEGERDLLAKWLCRTAEFGEWLLEQDNSSTLLNHKGEGNQRQGGTEDKSDLVLALKFADEKENL